MFDFGEELTVDSYRIPWLIWIQILVLFLLILLLYSFTNFGFDLSEEATASSPSSFMDVSSGKSLFRHSSAASSCYQVGGSQSIKGEIATSTSRGVLRVEESMEREDSNLTNVSLTNIFHPCFYFRLARTAFLKCLGLDSASDHSPPTERRKER